MARNIAAAWGRRADYVQEFHLVVFICCRELKGKSLDEYVKETTQLDDGAVYIDLKDWHRRKKNILFILDGLDECNNSEDSKEINNLLSSKNYGGSSILATTRPLLSDDTLITLRQFTKRVSIKGFNRDQIEMIIDNYFEERAGMSDKMKSKLFDSGNEAYLQLISCPLLCQLFCYLFDNDETFPEKATGVYLKLIECLIRLVNQISKSLIVDKLKNFTY